MGADAGESHHTVAIIGECNMKKNYADMDSLEEVRAIKEELSREFPTAQAFGEYLRKVPPLNPPQELRRKSRRASTKANGRPALRQRK